MNGGHSRRADSPGPDVEADLQALRDEVAQLREALRSRAVIEQAKGMLMLAHGIDADAAFMVLRATSNSHNRKLRDVAEDLVDRARPEPGPPVVGV